MIDREQVGLRIAGLRKKSGWSQALLAEKLNVSTQAVSKWETGGNLPDIELLNELAWLFDTTIDGILEGGDTFLQREESASLPKAVAALASTAERRRLLKSLSPYCSEAELHALARELAAGKLDLAFSARIARTDGSFERSALMPIEAFGENTLREIAPFFAKALGETLNPADAGLRRAAGLLICPKCGESLSLRTGEDGDCSFVCPQNHAFPVVDGVVDFGTREIPGELWSQYLKNYDFYLREQQSPGNPRYHTGAVPMSEVRWQHLKKRRPRVILDIASGTGRGIKYDLHRINWPCLVILTDLSHRVLKYDRRYFLENVANPYVDLLLLACDCAHLPLNDGCIDAAVSNGGYESMQEKMKDGFRESHRVLKEHGYAIYNMSILENRQSENTQKWIRLMSADSGLASCLGNLHDIGEWRTFCRQIGFSDTEAQQIYGELPAPAGDILPFENEVFQWTGEYVCLSQK